MFAGMPSPRLLPSSPFAALSLLAQRIVCAMCQTNFRKRLDKFVQIVYAICAKDKGGNCALMGGVQLPFSLSSAVPCFSRTAQGNATTTMRCMCHVPKLYSSCFPFVFARSEKAGFFICPLPCWFCAALAALCALFGAGVISVSCSCRMVAPWEVLEHNPQIL